MKRETLLEKGYSEEQVSDLLNLFHENSKTENNNLQSEVNNLQSEIDRLKSIEGKYNNVQKELDEINKSKMTEQEKLEADKKAAEENLRKSQVIYNTAKAKEILAGYDVDETLIANLVNGDENTTITNATQLKALLDAKIESTTLKVKEELSNLNVKPNPTNVPQDDGAMTFEKFSKLSASDQEQWIKENPIEFENL